MHVRYTDKLINYLHTATEHSATISFTLAIRNLYMDYKMHKYTHKQNLRSLLNQCIFGAGLITCILGKACIINTPQL